MDSHSVKATFRSFPSCSCSEHFRKYRWKSPYVSNDCLGKVCLYLNFLADFLVDIYEILNKNNSSNLDYQMWFKEGISLDDSNFDMENYSSLVDVKLLLKRILDGYWNKLLCKKIIESKVQLAPPTKNVIMAVLTPKSVIQLTAFIAFETGRKLNSACCNYVHFSHQPSISVAQKRSFPKSTGQ